MAETNLPQTEIPPIRTGTPLISPDAAVNPAPAYTSAERWLRRISVLMFVFFCAVVGMLLVILPWNQQWADNHLLMGYPRLQEILGNGFVRGLCTGLGVLDVWIGFQEAIFYHEEKQP